jgi:GNAT superfamily N-acetyltransferase
MYRKAAIRDYRPGDEALLFGLARLDRGADERTLTVLERDTVFVAEVEGGAAGYVACVRVGGTIRVDQLFVSPEHEAEGVGTQLLEYVEGFAISQGAARLRVVVEQDNDRARRFYAGRGFAVAGDDVVELVLPQT